MSHSWIKWDERETHRVVTSFFILVRFSPGKWCYFSHEKTKIRWWSGISSTCAIIIPKVNSIYLFLSNHRYWSWWWLLLRSLDRKSLLSNLRALKWLISIFFFSKKVKLWRSVMRYFCCDLVVCKYILTVFCWEPWKTFFKLPFQRSVMDLQTLVCNLCYPITVRPLDRYVTVTFSISV